MSHDTPLNAVKMPRPYGKLSPVELEELTEWFVQLATNENPDTVAPPPDFYRATIAHTFMQNMGITKEGDINVVPWELPRGVADFYCDVWIAQRISALRLHKQQKEDGENTEEGIRQRSRAVPMTRRRVVPRGD